MENLVENLDTRIQQVIDMSVEEERKINSLRENKDNLLSQQAQKIEEVALKLLPLMHTIKDMGYKFHVKDINYVSRRGPVIGFKDYEDELFVFDVANQFPCVIKVSERDQPSNNVNYHGLLKEFEFTQIMNNLLSILDHYQDIQEHYQEVITKLETDLNKYENVL